MSAILDQLGVNYTFFIHVGIVFALFLVLSAIYFKPFMRLFHERHRKTVEDREAAQKMISEAEAKFDEYRKRIQEERVAARADLEKVLQEARREESRILAGAREEAKKVTQEAAESISKQRTELKKQLEADVESLAKTISDLLLSKRA